MELQWFPSHVGILGNEVANSLSMNAYIHDNRTILLKRFVEARLLIRAVIRLRHPDASVSPGTAPPPVQHNTSCAPLIKIPTECF